MSKKSPYDGLDPSAWEDKTKELIDEYPIPMDSLVSAVLTSWNNIVGSKIGEDLIIGINYFPTPQILGDYLHELIPIELSKEDTHWRKGVEKAEKDVVVEDDDTYSFEIKTSSHPTSIFGNRSYAQASSKSAKDKSGYYLAINTPAVHKSKSWAPISKIRFGWLDADDWRGQKSATGQQASLSPEVLNGKFITLY